MAISDLPKMLVIVGVKIDGVYHDMENFKHIMCEDQRIFNIMQFPTFSIDIDFNPPEPFQNEMVDITLEVERECPVGKQFGVSGLGEGVVWECFDDGMRYIFKVKGDKHAGVSKVKTLKKVDTVRMGKIVDLANKVTPTWRLAQMIEKACDTMNGGHLDRTKLGEYIGFVFKDIIKEDSDIIADAGFVMKDINKEVSSIARQYFFQMEQEDM